MLVKEISRYVVLLLDKQLSKVVHDRTANDGDDDGNRQCTKFQSGHISTCAFASYT
jgi:hypothetical protein